jgi:hypothetical protein
MLAALAPSTFATDHDLEDARQSLAYWEARAHTLPRHAVRRRREAREMAARWSARVSEAEQMAYGRGLLGALLLIVAEQRLPQAARHRGRLVARRLVQAFLAVCVCLVALAVAGMWALVELLAAVLRAVS